MPYIWQSSITDYIQQYDPLLLALASHYNSAIQVCEKLLFFRFIQTYIATRSFTINLPWHSINYDAMEMLTILLHFFNFIQSLPLVQPLSEALWRIAVIVDDYLAILSQKCLENRSQPQVVHTSRDRSHSRKCYW